MVCKLIYYVVYSIFYMYTSILVCIYDCPVENDILRGYIHTISVLCGVVRLELIESRYVCEDLQYCKSFCSVGISMPKFIHF